MIKRVVRIIISKIKRSLNSFSRPDSESIFTHIYKNNVWGNNSAGPYYSGGGSDDEFAIPYVELIVNFIKENKIRSVIDLGCGDFRIGKKICDLTVIDYTGLDIVADLIEFNKKKFTSPTINFYKKNIVDDEIPIGELYLIRQVFQHLSNSHIKKVLKKLPAGKQLIVTEHQPAAINFTPNVDKPVGPGIRLENNSGVYLEYPPYNKKVKKILEVIPQNDPSSIIATYIVHN